MKVIAICYALTKKLGVKESTLYRMRKDQPMTTTTPDDLCRVLPCEVQDIMCYLPDEKSSDHHNTF